MFTVKQVDETGVEWLVRTPGPIKAEPLGSPGAFDGPRGPLIASVSFPTGAAAELTVLHGGTVYVMNEAGRTVERYHLAGNAVAAQQAA